MKIGDFEKPEYIVLRTDGKDMKDGKNYVEITKLFYEKYDDFVISDVTGWGGEGLIVLNSKSPDGETGPSFWFDLSGFGFIRLSTIFN